MNPDPRYRDQILERINLERSVQDQKHPSKLDAARGVLVIRKLARKLEVAVLSGDQRQVDQRLIEIAACCVAVLDVDMGEPEDTDDSDDDENRPFI